MKLNTSTSLNDCIKRVAEGDSGAACVLALLTKDYSHSAMGWIHALDSQEIYGKDIWIGFNNVCSHDIDMFLSLLSGKNLMGHIEEWKRGK